MPKRRGDYFTGSEYYVWPRWNIRTTGWLWNSSASGTDNWYLTTSDSGTPVHPVIGNDFTSPPMVEENGTDLTTGVLGNLSAGEFAWGNADSLAFNTLYVRMNAGGNPDSQADGFLRAGGIDVSGGGTSEATAWETAKYAIETGITRNTSQGDRVNQKAGDAANLSYAIDPTLYAAAATEGEPLMWQGYNNTPNDGGVFRIDVASGLQLISTTFDYMCLVDMIMIGNYDAGAVIAIDRNSVAYNVYARNDHNLVSRPIDMGISSEFYNCYLEGYNDAAHMVNSSPSSVVFCKIVNRGKGGCSASAVYNCLCIASGGLNLGEHIVTASAFNTAGIALGSPSNQSHGFVPSDGGKVIGCYAENVGYGFTVGTTADRVGFYNNSYYNCLTSGGPGDGGSQSIAIFREDAVEAANSIFADTGNFDFTIIDGNIKNVLSSGGFFDNGNGFDNESFLSYKEPGLGTLTVESSGSSSGCETSYFFMG